MKNLQKTKSLILYNIGTLIVFESLYKILSLLIFTPLFFKIFDLIMKATGYKYLTLENLLSFLINPLTLFLLLFFLILLLGYTMFDITTIIVIFDASYHKRKIKVLDAIRISLKKIIRLIHPKNWLLFFFVLFLIPILNLGVASNYITTLKIPEYILEFILQNKTLLGITILLISFGIILLFRFIYTLHYFVLEEVTVKEARKRSKNLGRKKHWKDFITLLGIQGIITIIYLLLIGVGIFIILFFNKIFVSILLLKSIATTIIGIFIAISFIIFTLLATPTGYAVLSVLYYLHKRDRKEPIYEAKETINNKDSKLNKGIKILIFTSIVLALIGGTIFTYGLYNGTYNLNIEHTRMVEVTAHRGLSKEYPENTMKAFIAAKNALADFIELDVQQTKDKKLIVMHDSSFKRTTGVDKKTWELDYEEVKTLDAGSFFSEEFKEEKIPLLEEVIIFAKENNIRLNIELKPTSHEIDLEKSVIDLIHKYNFEERCIVTSGHYETLTKIKELDKEIKTGYVMTLAYGNMEEFVNADAFSIEATIITKSLVKEIHKEGKEIYAWTLNTKENIEKMIKLRVDNIITDNVTLAKDTIFESNTSNLINEFIRFVEEICR